MEHGLPKDLLFTWKPKTTEKAKSAESAKAANQNIDEEKKKAITAYLSHYFQYGRNAKIELEIYAKHCYIEQDEKPTFAGFMKALDGVKNWNKATGKTYYYLGDPYDKAIVDRVIQNKMIHYFEWLRRHPQGVALTPKEENYLKDNGLSFNPQPGKAQKARKTQKKKTTS